MPAELREALTAAGASALVQKVIDPLLLEYQRRYSPLLRSIPSVKWNSDSYWFNTRTVNPNGGAVTDGGARVVSNSTYVQNSFQMKHYQIVGAITGYAGAVATANGNLRGMEIQGSVQGMSWDLEHSILWGSAGATQFGAYPLFDGLDSQVNNYSGSNQNCIDKSSDSGGLTLAFLDELADMVETNAAMSVFDSSWQFVMSNTAVSRISQLLTNQQRFVDQVEVAAGLIVPSYRGIPLIKSSFLSTRNNTMGAVTSGTATTGGAIPASTTYHYKVSAIIARQGEIAACADVSQATGSGTGTNTITLSFSAPSGLDGLGPVLYKVYRGTSNSNHTLLGVVDATVGLAADGITPIATTSIVDDGVTLTPKNGSTAPATVPATYVGGNTNKVPSALGFEPIFLHARDENFLCRPYVRDFQPVDIYPTTASPDSLPYALISDTTLAVRAPKFVGQLTGVKVSL